jgi:hypothetical protein
LIYAFFYRIGGQNACFAIGNRTVQNFAENKGEITGISFQKVDDHEEIVLFVTYLINAPLQCHIKLQKSCHFYIGANTGSSR